MIRLEFKTEDLEEQQTCNRYWRVDEELNFVGSVKKIAEEQGLSVTKMLAKIRKHCSAFATGISCSDCGAARELTSRSDFQQIKHLVGTSCPGMLCEACHTEENKRRRERAEQLATERAAANRIQADRQKQLIVDTFSNTNVCDISPREISLELAVYLISMIRKCGDEDLTWLRPVREEEELLSPTGEFDCRILDALYKNRLIDIHPSSPVEAVDFSDGQIKTFNLTSVAWRLSLGRSDAEIREFVSELESIIANRDWPGSWEDNWIPLWKDIALQECVQYLLHNMAERGFQFNPGKKTKLVFEQMLEYYSVSQGYSFIWRAAKDAADFLVRKQVSRKHAANTVITGVQRSMERARDNEWDVKHFGRNFECPRSNISHVLFSSVLRMGDSGFTDVLGQTREIEIERR
jgi:hypothetical protein